MIQVIQGFRLNTRDAVDNRIVLTKEEMRNINDNLMPVVYFAICKDDGYLYLYNKENPVSNDSETGKFVQFSSSTIESISVNGTALPITDKNVDLPLATAERFGMIKLGKGLAIGTNDEVYIDFTALDDATIPFTKIDFSNVIIDASNISII